MSEKKKKVFISGPMRGIKDFNKPAFDKAEQWLTQAGYSVFNPARMHFDDAWDHSEIMRIDLAALAQCDYILMLDKWYYSKGAIQEYHYANAIGVKQLTMSDIERPIKTCGTCKHNNGSQPLRSCSDCGPFKNWESKEAPWRSEKACSGCKYHKYSVNEEPCKSCNPVLHNGWEEPKPASEKSCNTCKYYMRPLFEEPCNSCNAMRHANWEPKEDKPPVCGESKDA